MESSSNLYLYIIVLCSAVTFWFAKTLYSGLTSPLNHIPGPWYARYTNLWLKKHVLSGRRLYYIDALHKRYGPVVRIAPEEVAISDLEGFRRIHGIGNGFLKSQWYQKLNAQPEPGIFSMSDAKQHAARRKLFARAFSNTSLRQDWEPVVREKVKLAISSIKKEAEIGHSDVLKWWTLMTTDVIGHLSFGESFRMLELGKKNEYIHTLETAMLQGGIRAELPPLYRLFRVLPVPSVRHLMRADDRLFEYGGRAIQNLRGQGQSTRNIFSNMLAKADGGEKSALTDLSVRLEAGNLIVAGSDTTAVTLTYLVWAILKRPDLQQRLENEIATLSPDFQDTDLENLSLLNGVVEETLRLYGAAPGSLPRIVPAGGANFRGFFVPQGITVSTQAYTMHRDPAVFPDPYRFDETRFIPSTKLTDDQKLAFSPFGAGSRVCIGMHLARMELRLAAALFFRECRGARLADTMTDAVMDMENRFLIAPAGHRCDITLRR